MKILINDYSESTVAVGSQSRNMISKNNSEFHFTIAGNISTSDVFCIVNFTVYLIMTHLAMKKQAFF